MNKKFIEDAKEKFPDLLLKEVTLESEVGKKKQEEMIREEEDRNKSNLNEQLCVSTYVKVPWCNRI